MTPTGIFLQTTDGLTVLEQTPYDTEDVLQRALETHPEVIAGSTTDGSGGAGRLLLISRELGVPSADAAGRMFSLDHLFVDQDCVPVFVEVKRASDTRIRREVVGQMLDYAANGVKHWPIEHLRVALAARAERAGVTVEELLGELGTDLAVDAFWEQVEQNLRAGRVRLLFVADQLPDDLVRIIEFLNEQMSPAEVLGVELRQYVAGDHVAYVPRVVGQTTEAQTAKSRAGRAWTEETFLEVAEARRPAAEVAFMRRLFDHRRERGVRFSWGRGVTPGVAGWYDVNGRATGVWVLNVNGEGASSRAYLVLYLGDVVTWAGVPAVEAAAELLATIPTLTSKVAVARASGWRKYPSVYLADVVGTPHEETLVRAIDRLIAPPAS